MADTNTITAALAAAGAIGAEAWLQPSTVFRRGNPAVAAAMIRSLIGPDDGDAHILAYGDDGRCRRFPAGPGVDGFEAEVFAALSAAGHLGAGVALNELSPGGSGLPFGREVTALRVVVVTFRQRRGETDADFIERAVGSRLKRFVRRMRLNPVIVYDGIGDRYAVILEIEEAAPLRDDADRARAAGVIDAITAHLGGDPAADPLPGVAPLAGVEMVNGSGEIGGRIYAFRPCDRDPGPTVKLPSALDGLERFAADLATRDPDQPGTSPAIQL